MTDGDLESGPEAGYEQHSVAPHLGGVSTRLDAIERFAAVTLNEYRLTVRSRWAVALTALFALLGGMLVTFSGSAVGPEGFERIVASLASLAVYLLPLAALALGYDAVVGPEERGWLDLLFSLPIARAHVVVGAFVGRGIVLTGATTVGFGLVGVPLILEYGFGDWDAYVVFLFGAIAVGLVFLSLAVLVSTVTTDKAHALGVALLVWAWFVLLHDLVAIGTIAAFDLSDAALSAMILTNPIDVFRVLVLAQLEVGGQAGFSAVLARTNLSTGVLAGALFAWIVVPTILAALLIRRRSV